MDPPPKKSRACHVIDNYERPRTYKTMIKIQFFSISIDLFVIKFLINKRERITYIRGGGIRKQ